MIEQLEDRSLLAATMTVNSVLDTNARDSALTLREAILVSNRTLPVASLTLDEMLQVAGAPTSNDTDTIAFNIPGSGVRTIAVMTELPPLTDAAIIDGYTQPGSGPNTNPIDNPDLSKRGFNGTVLVELTNGGGVLEGLVLPGGSTVRGLAINRFGHNGINVGSNSVVEGNLIGLDPTGTLDRGNSGAGIVVDGSNNRIGGTAPASRNIVSKNFYWGIYLTGSKATGNQVVGNFVGTDASGTKRLGNGQSGIELGGASNNTIGGTASGSRNVVSANGSFVNANGIDLFYSSNFNVVQGNYVGLDVTGTQPLGNTQVGIGVYSSSNNLIGGTTAGAGNVVSDSKTSSGISLSHSSQNTVQGNFVGTDASGTLPLGNFLDGVDLFDFVSSTVVGGTVPAAANLIAFNRANGVHVRTDSGSQKNNILGNKIFSNAALGIELGGSNVTIGDGVTPNDAGDADSGPNNLQNFPEISAASLNAGVITARYVVPSTTTNSVYPLRVEFFKADSDGHEGQTFLGFDTYTSAAAGTMKTFVFTPAIPIGVGNRLVATATDSNGNTSEFSASIMVDGPNVPPVLASIQGNNSISANESTVALVDALNVDFALVATDSDYAQALTFSIVVNPFPPSGCTAYDPSNPAQTNLLQISIPTQLAIPGAPPSGASAASGTLRIKAGPNAAGTWCFLVRASDGVLSAQREVTLTVNRTNTNPMITSNGSGDTASISVPENTIAVADMDAVDLDTEQTLTFSITGGPDANKFAMNSASGLLTFLSPPNFESPTDVGGNRVYDIVVQVSDGTVNDTQTLAVTVTNVNEPPVITTNGGSTSASISVFENTTAVTDVDATDPDAGATLTYSKIGGADTVKFSISSTTGVLTFVNAPNFESPTDAGANNIYDVIVRVSDGSLSSTQTIAVTVTNVNEKPTITSNGGGTTASISVPENSQLVTDVNATDPDASATLTYSINGTDATTFAIDAASGLLTFITTPDFENPADADRNNIYSLTVQVSDGSLVNTQTMLVTVTDVVEACSTIVVNTNDSGAGSLREAINCANSISGTQTISFNIPGSGVHTIRPLSSLPSITEGAIVDGYTQPGATMNTDPTGFNGVLLVEIDGTNAGNVNGLVIASDGNTVRGLVINRFHGDGTVGLGNGIYVTGSFSTRMGNLLTGNFLGTDAAGTSRAGNDVGVNINSFNTTVGGTTPAARNVISGNNRSGLEITGQQNFLRGNFIGTDASGSVALANLGAGLADFGGSTTIGGATAGAGNVISGNTDAGIRVTGFDDDATIQGNWIGTDARGTGAIGNLCGVLLEGEGSLVGGTQPGTGNTIAFNGTGVLVSGSPAKENRIVGNAIFNNSTLDIDISPSGTTPNDPGDADSGPNNLQNFPEVSSVFVDGTVVTVKYAVSSATANSAYPLRVEFFKAASNGRGGQVFLGFDTYTAAEAGTTKTLTFVPAASITSADKIVATATDNNGNTSEFGITGALPAGANDPPSGTDTAVAALEDVNYSFKVIDFGFRDSQDSPPSVFKAVKVVTLPVVGSLTNAGADVRAGDVISAATLNNGFFRYRAPLNVNGNDVARFTFQVQDDGGTANAGIDLDQTPNTIVINVTSVNDPPTALNDSYSTPKDAPLAIAAPGVLANDMDVDVGDSKTVVAINYAATVNVIYDEAVSGDLPDFAAPPTLILQAGTSELRGNTGVTPNSSDFDKFIFRVPANSQLTSAKFSAIATTGGLNSIAWDLYRVTALPLTKLGTVSVSVASDQTILELQVPLGPGDYQLRESSIGLLNASSGFVDYRFTFNVTSGSSVGTPVTLASGAIVALQADGGLRYDPNGKFVALGVGQTATDSFIYSIADQQGSTSSATVTVTIVGNATTINQAPTITSHGAGAAANVSVPENTTAAADVDATDPDIGSLLTYSISDGADAAKFSIDSATGALTFITAPNFESPTDAGSNNVYDVIVRVSDGSLTDTQTLAVTVTNVNEPPTINSNGGGAAAGISMPENTQLVTDVNATDPDASTTLVYSVSGPDAGQFSINSATGILTFVTPPDFENPADADGNHVYELTVQVSDGALIDAQTLLVTVTDETDSCSTVVTNTNDSGVGSLRSAITCANATQNMDRTGDGIADPDPITFAMRPNDARHFYYRNDVLNGGLKNITVTTATDDATIGNIDPDWRHSWYSIQLNTSLPAITEAVTIDGYSQPGATTNTNGPSLEGNALLRIEVTEAATGAGTGMNAFVLSAGATTISGLAINRFDRHGIQILSDGNIAVGNFIGTDVSATLELGNGGDGVNIDDSNGNLVGGSGSAARNYIRGNGGSGVALINGAAQNSVQGNFIARNTATPSNTDQTKSAGVLIDESDHNTIGGVTAGAGNSISGHVRGVLIVGAAAHHNLLQGNTVGFGNDFGVYLRNTHDNTIGGTTAAARNIISGNGEGVRLESNSTLVACYNNIIEGNYIGTNAAGTAAVPNSYMGVRLVGASYGSGVYDNTIGGLEEGAGNVISGNYPRGVVIEGPLASANLVQGNLIGTNAAGTAALGNAQVGIEIFSGAHGNTIGGLQSGARNIISANPSGGLWIDGIGSNSNVVQGNYIGTDISGNIALGNGNSGIELWDRTANNTIQGNLISGNVGDGIILSSNSSNLIRSNQIGVKAGGVQPLGNTKNGIYVDGANNSSIGGTMIGQGNIIAFNGKAGITVDSTATGIGILGNSIYSNTLLGIDLSKLLYENDGVTLNDLGDGDTGVNNFQNWPTLSAAMLAGSSLSINYSVSSLATNSVYPLRIEFFKADSDGQEGRTFLGFDIYTATGATANKTFTFAPAAAIVGGDMLVATATDANGNTSEFSASVTLPPCTVVTNTNDSGPGSLRDAIVCANNKPGTDTITFNIPGSSVHRISPVSPLPTITDPVIIDGYTQPGASVNTQTIDDPDPAKRGLNTQLMIELSGVTAGGSGLMLAANDSIVRGLVINNFATDGIVIDGGQHNLVTGNFIGVDPTGTLARPNGRNGIFVFHGASENILGTNGDGDKDAAERNLISGNLFGGIAISGAGSDQNRVAGNLIGTSVSGTAALANARRAVDVVEGGQQNIIGTNVDGTADSAEGNVLSGNGWDGIVFSGAGTSFNVAAGNRIGLDVTGTVDLGNTLNGVGIFSGATSNIIGGVVAVARNVISGNDQFGISIAGTNTSNNVVVGNYVGTNATGNSGIANANEGVRLELGASDNRIGIDSTIPGAAVGNLISGNGAVGILIRGLGTNRNIVAGNLVGTDATGLAAIGNKQSGVRIEAGAQANQIGANGDGANDESERNVISGNVTSGVAITGVGTDNNVVAGNLIGTDSTGTALLGNGQRGINIFSGAQSNRIGTDANGIADLAERNVISSNGGQGIQITGTGTSHNVVAGNLIGTDASGNSALGNALQGIWIWGGATLNTIGGTTLAAENAIAFNLAQGVLITDVTTTSNAVWRNSLARNSGLGMDLGGGGVTANDNGDADSGPNNLQNFPEITSAILNGGQLAILYNIPSATANSTYPLRVEFFQADIDGQEGQKFLGFDTFTAADFAVGSKTLTLAQVPDVAIGTRIVATASDNTNNTSEFSAAATVSPRIPTPDLSVTKAATPNPVAPGANLTYTITVSNAGPDAAADVRLSDLIPLHTVFVSAMQTAGPPFTLLLPGVAQTNELTATAPSLAAGASVVFTLTVQVSSDFSSGATISNTALVATSSNDLNPENNAVTQISTVEQVGVALDCSPLHYGTNTCTIRGATPGGSVLLVMGTHEGDKLLEPYGVTVGISDARIVAQSIVQPDGTAVIPINVTSGMPLESLLLQGIEQAPQVRVTNVIKVGAALYAQGGQGAGTNALTSSDLSPIFSIALSRWQATGISAGQLAQLHLASIQIADLPEGMLGQTVDHQIFVDPTAAGYGWFVDATAGGDAEFYATALASELKAMAGTSAVGQMDLLTVLMHEIGHIVGLEDVPASPTYFLMSGTLGAGTRRLPEGSPAINAYFGDNQFRTNLANSLDVNGDGTVTASDVLMIINVLNAGAQTWLAANIAKDIGTKGPFLDVDGDKVVAPSDALAVINYLNSVPLFAIAAGEAEAPNGFPSLFSLQGDDSELPWDLPVQPQTTDFSQKNVASSPTTSSHVARPGDVTDLMREHLGQAAASVDLPPHDHGEAETEDDGWNDLLQLIAGDIMAGHRSS